jgi:hypothetical protein
MYSYKLTDIYKQIKEEAEQAPQSQYKIYCDMDGVLCDFNSRFKQINPENLTPGEYIAEYSESEFWKLIGSSYEDKEKFWSEMSWMPDGKQLWEYISKYNPTLLSAPSYDASSRYGKRLWVDKNLPGVELILAAAKKKQNYSKPNRILIDDKASNVEQWISKGGEGILHKNTTDTIQQLQKILK